MIDGSLTSSTVIVGGTDMTSSEALTSSEILETQHAPVHRRPYRISRSHLFLYEGHPGERYVIVGVEKVVEITAIGEGSISVVFPALGTKVYSVAHHTEVRSFDPQRDAELIKRVARIKPEEEEEEKVQDEKSL